MKTLWVLLVVSLGTVLPAQAGINAELRRHAGHPLLAALVSFGVGFLVLAAAVLALRVPLPAWSALRGAPWWAWLGGLLGAGLVFTSVVVAPRLGAAVLVAGLVAGQLAASVLLDHFGWVGYPVRPVNLGRIAGVLLLAAGVWLVQRSS